MTSLTLFRSCWRKPSCGSCTGCTGPARSTTSVWPAAWRSTA
jgi:hypothetical protein